MSLFGHRWASAGGRISGRAGSVAETSRTLDPGQGPQARTVLAGGRGGAGAGLSRFQASLSPSPSSLFPPSLCTLFSAHSPFLALSLSRSRSRSSSLPRQDRAYEIRLLFLGHAKIAGSSVFGPEPIVRVGHRTRSTVGSRAIHATEIQAAARRGSAIGASWPGPFDLVKRAPRSFAPMGATSRRSDFRRRAACPRRSDGALARRSGHHSAGRYHGKHQRWECSDYLGVVLRRPGAWCDPTGKRLHKAREASEYMADGVSGAQFGTFTRRRKGGSILRPSRLVSVFWRRNMDTSPLIEISVIIRAIPDIPCTLICE